MCIFVGHPLFLVYYECQCNTITIRLNKGREMEKKMINYEGNECNGNEE